MAKFNGCPILKLAALPSGWDHFLLFPAEVSIDFSCFDY